ncbi:MFS transporter [Conexibacter sp. S30A1]|uniref:MFS transporter n=1 Tax=Conexibacter sp. S30A1 TaxID=2937800 RepID=UPI00200C19F1|nr:MFS transporter [Conexibacter sp. S30A1]
MSPNPVSAAADRAGADGGLSRGMVLLLACTTGASVANMYYAQPLLHTLGRAFAVGAGTTGLLVTVSQAGFVLGLVFLVPLGDLMERRRLIVSGMIALALGQAVAAAAPGLAVFAAATLFVGVASFVAQVIVPMSSHLAAEHERGQVVGTVMSGLLIGILVSRTLSGIVAELFGWRIVFATAAAVMVALALLLHRALPRVAPTSDLPYGTALRSVLKLVSDEPLLRQRMLLGACAFGAFSILWTSLAFLLSGVHSSHYHYGNAVIGLFGLAGVAGASAAQVVGRMADRERGRLATTITLLSLLASWLLLALGARSVVVLILGIMVLDLGVQGAHIGNQSAIYRLDPDARSRITTAYMSAYFLGGIVCSAFTGALYAADGWGAVCALGAGVSLLALLAWAATARRVSIPGARERAAPSVSG